MPPLQPSLSRNLSVYAQGIKLARVDLSALGDLPQLALPPAGARGAKSLWFPGSHAKRRRRQVPLRAVNARLAGAPSLTFLLCGGVCAERKPDAPAIVRHYAREAVARLRRLKEPDSNNELQRLIKQPWRGACR